MYAFICPVTYISATVTPTSVKFCMMVDMSPGHKVSPTPLLIILIRKQAGQK